MNGNFDETILTSYALGEVTGEQARTIEARLETDAEARAFVAAQQELAASLEEALCAQVGAGLDDDRRGRVLDGADGGRAAGGFMPFHVLRAAAVVFVCVGLAFVWASSLPDRERPGGEEVAIHDEAPREEFAGGDADGRDVHREVVDFFKSQAGEAAKGSGDRSATVTVEGVDVVVKDEVGLYSRTVTAPEGKIYHATDAPSQSDAKRVLTVRGTPATPGSGSAGYAPGGGGPVGGVTGGAGGGGTTPGGVRPGTSGGVRLGFEAVAPSRAPKPKSATGSTGRRKGAPAPAKANKLPVTGRGTPLSKRKKARVVDSLERVRRSRREAGRANTERYNAIQENEFQSPGDQPLSTLSIDVDTAAYANVRRFLSGGRLPPPDAVRIEELINYFNYGDPGPEGDEPFAVATEVAACPWNLRHRLLRVGIKAREVDMDGRAASNLVFLLDVSGSMSRPEKLPLLKQAMKMLVDSLDERDTVSIVVYAGSSGLVLPPTNGASKGAILGALDQLRAGGSTNGEAGIQQAYATAMSSFIKGGNNRVLWCTDGDLNVGMSDQGGLVRMIKEKAETGVFLSVLGFGTGNLKDSTLEQIADKGNGAYSYIDGVREARKVLVEEMGGTLITVAKDVKIQVEFNPAVVGAYRLIGYENRLLAARDFNDDRKDAGEIGSGHSIVALYEVLPQGVASDGAPAVDPLKYQRRPDVVGGGAGEIGTVKLRYKQPDGDTSTKREFVVHDTSRSYAEASIDFKLAASVAAFGMVLRSSAYVGAASMAMIHELAGETLTEDRGGYRAEFMDLVDRAAKLMKQRVQR